jgi:hypothetical protein
MQSCAWGMALLAVWGCRARGVLEVATASESSGVDGGSEHDGGGSGSDPQRFAHFRAGCAPNDGRAVALSIDDGLSACSSGPPVSALSFLIWGQDLAGLHAGSVLKIGAGPKATTQAVRTLPSGRALLQVTEGSLVFTTYVERRHATGSYDVTYADHRTEHGTFDAVWCPGGGACG